MEKNAADHMGSMLVYIKGKNRNNRRIEEWKMPHIFYIYKRYILIRCTAYESIRDKHKF